VDIWVEELAPEVAKELEKELEDQEYTRCPKIRKWDKKTAHPCILRDQYPKIRKRPDRRKRRKKIMHFVIW
jgi:hypothetical protein